MVLGSGGGDLLFPLSRGQKRWEENQTTLCSSVSCEQVRGDAEIRIPSVDETSSTKDNGVLPLPSPTQVGGFSEPFVRLNAVRDLFNSQIFDVEDVIERYLTWVSQDEYLLLQRTVIEPGVHGSTKWDSQYIAVKCSKRGNDVYRHRVRNSLSSVLQGLPNLSFFNPRDRDFVSKKTKTPLISVTLTYDTKRCSINEAWENIGKEFNRWISNLRKKFGSISIIRTWEAFQNDYPHINAILLFHDTDFRVFRYKSKFRVINKAAFSQHWHSYVDVRAVANLKTDVSYIMKYITKELFTDKAILTLAMLWIFRKRSFSVSRDFASMIRRLDFHMHNSHQVSLTGEKITELEWHFIGIFSKSDLSINENVWTIQIPKEIVKNSPKLAAEVKKSCSGGYQFLVA